MDNSIAESLPPSYTMGGGGGGKNTALDIYSEILYVFIKVHGLASKRMAALTLEATETTNGK
jgi:hypothetical protein